MRYDDDVWAVFWCSLLGPILLDEVESGGAQTVSQELEPTGSPASHGCAKTDLAIDLKTQGATVSAAQDPRLAEAAS